MAKLGAVIDDWMVEADVTVSAVQCWTSLEEFFGVVPCTLMSMMSNDLLPSACEVDVCGTLSMYALTLASETPSALLDWNNNYGDDPDKAVCFHCSNLPKHFFEDVKMDYQEIIAGTVGKENTFGTMVGRVKAGPMSFARFSTDDRTGHGSAGTWARGASPTIRWRRSAAPASSRFRGCRICCATSARTGSSITSPATSRRSRTPCTRRRRATSAGTCCGTDEARRQTADGGRQTNSILQMAIVAGVDFGTQSVRVSIVDSVRGSLGWGVSEYPVKRDRNDPDFATQSHEAHMNALVAAMKTALDASKVAGASIKAIALDTTGSTVVPVGEGLVPLDDYYLWCDHRAKAEAALITEVAHETGLPAIRRLRRRLFVGVGIREAAALAAAQSGQARTLRHGARALRHGRGGALRHHRSRSAAAQHLRDGPQVALERRTAGCRRRSSSSRSIRSSRRRPRALRGRYLTSNTSPGNSRRNGRSRLGLAAGIPIPVGAFDAHWDAIGAGIAEGDVVNVVGTATCIMAIAKETGRIPGLCGVVKGSIHPAYVGIEAGLSATGYLFEAIARRSNTTVAALGPELDTHRAGETGLLRIGWDNGDRTVLVNPNLGGVTLGWNLNHTAADELFAAIEGTAFHTRIILDRMPEHGVPINRVIHGGGIPQKNDVLNQVYANVLEQAGARARAVRSRRWGRRSSRASRRGCTRRSKRRRRRCARRIARCIPIRLRWRPTSNSTRCTGTCTSRWVIRVECAPRRWERCRGSGNRRARPTAAAAVRATVRSGYSLNFVASTLCFNAI